MELGMELGNTEELGVWGSCIHTGEGVILRDGGVLTRIVGLGVVGQYDEV